MVSRNLSVFARPSLESTPPDVPFSSGRLFYRGQTWTGHGTYSTTHQRYIGTSWGLGLEMPGSSAWHKPSPIKSKATSPRNYKKPPETELNSDEIESKITSLDKKRYAPFRVLLTHPNQPEACEFISSSHCATNPRCADNHTPIS